MKGSLFGVSVCRYVGNQDIFNSFLSWRLERVLRQLPGKTYDFPVILLMNPTMTGTYGNHIERLNLFNSPNHEFAVRFQYYIKIISEGRNILVG